MSLDYQQIWNQCKEHLHANEDTRAFVLVENQLSYAGCENGTLHLDVPSQFIYDRVQQYIPYIVSTFKDLSGEDIKLALAINNTRSVQSSPKAEDESAEPAKVVVEQKKDDARQNSGVNPDYTFESFVPGSNSLYAYNACLAIAKNPGETYNPCLLYGGVGLGKTHLMSAIGNYVLEHDPSLKVLYITAEAFTNEFISAIGNNQAMQQFRSKFRKVDVLLMDDIQFLQNKTQSGEEIFNTFNALYDSKRQMVFTCDRPLNELKGVFERLLNRFSRGLNADLQPPAYETRVAILQKKCQLAHKVVDEDIIDYIAENVQSNVRDLEASLIKLTSYSDLVGVPLTLDNAKDLLSTMPFMQTKKVDSGISPTTIMKTVAEYFGITVSDLKSKKKTKSVAQPRHIAIYLTKLLTDLSFTEIGAEFGGRDHTTIMNSNDRIGSLVKVNVDTKATVEKLKKLIKQKS